MLELSSRFLFVPYFASILAYLFCFGKTAWKAYVLESCVTTETRVCIILEIDEMSSEVF